MRRGQRDAVGAEAGRDELASVLQELGGKLADAFLPAKVAAALASAVAEAVRLNGALQLALDIADPFADLPWETLRLPQTGALALHPRVELFRRIDTGGAAPAVAIPGPLRILVAIGSPEAQNARGELLDMEAELQRILTPPISRGGRARHSSTFWSRAVSRPFTRRSPSIAITCCTSLATRRRAL